MISKKPVNLLENHCINNLIRRINIPNYEKFVIEHHSMQNVIELHRSF